MSRGGAAGLVIFASIAVWAFGSGGQNTPSQAPSPRRVLLVAASAPASSTAVPAPSVSSSTTAPPPATVSEPEQRQKPPPPPNRPRLIVTGHDVPMRSTPQPKGTIIDRLRQGLAVEEVERADGWVRVRFPLTTAEGWVKTSLVRPAQSAGKAEQTTTAAPKPSVLPVLATSVVVARILAASRADYPGNCACPDDTDKRGSRCGKRSAYSRPGGYAPLCYPKDVTAEMIAEYRRTHTAAAQ